MKPEEILDHNNEKAKPFLTFKKFYSLEEAQEFHTLLEQHKIPAEVEDNTPPVSDLFIGKVPEPYFALKINATHFTKATALLNELAKRQVNDADKDYYLFQFTNDELLEVLMQPDKWSEYDRQLSIKILNEKGVTVTDELLKTFTDKRLKESAQKEHHSVLWTVFGYISAFLGGLLGIAIGIHMWTSKKTLSDGSRVYTYGANDRMHGKAITLIGTMIFAYVIYLRLMGYWIW